ncbi:MAG: hypothetical protein JJU41_10010 [Bacteroidetes bacterium]|nr:hypothetical protein [Bacteroidota bacterium]MCH8523504.1 hypothetical protein [Balneolales bacterium]
MFQNSFSPISQITSALAEFIQMEPPTPPVPEMERSYESNFNLFKDSEKREKKKKEEESGEYNDQQNHTDDMMLPQLMLMAVNRDMREMLRHLFRPEQQTVFMSRYHLRESLGFEAEKLFSPLYMQYSDIDVVRTRQYLIQQDIAKLLARRTLMIFDNKPN